VIAPLSERLQDRSLPAPGLLAHILVAKYYDHLPLYRQEQIFARRHQVHLPRQTLARWAELATDWLQPIYETIRTGVMAGGYVQVDETPVSDYSDSHLGQPQPEEAGRVVCTDRNSIREGTSVIQHPGGVRLPVDRIRQIRCDKPGVTAVRRTARACEDQVAA